MFLALQLPDGASAQRTDAAEQKITNALLKTPGIEGVIAVNDFLAADAGAEHQRGLLLCQSEAVGAAQEQAGTARIHSEQSAKAACRRS